ncbi:hypothetical protein C8J56DRAFT_1052139 [Mycena floridula]|nr:hypothetical protein C8J56DRAFT_1052139 [Mycena floridula]
MATSLREADITILSAVTWQHSTSSCDSTALEDVLCACSAYEKRPVILMMSATAPESPPLAVSELRHLHSIGMTLGHTKLASLDATSSSTDKICPAYTCSFDTTTHPAHSAAFSSADMSNLSVGPSPEISV